MAAVSAVFVAEGLGEGEKEVKAGDLSRSWPEPLGQAHSRGSVTISGVNKDQRTKELRTADTRSRALALETEIYRLGSSGRPLGSRHCPPCTDRETEAWRVLPRSRSQGCTLSPPCQPPGGTHSGLTAGVTEQVDFAKVIS